MAMFTRRDKGMQKKERELQRKKLSKMKRKKLSKLHGANQEQRKDDIKSVADKKDNSADGCGPLSKRKSRRAKCQSFHLLSGDGCGKKAALTTKG